MVYFVMIMVGFEDLEVWKACRQFRIDCSKIVKSFPIEEKYRLTDQLIRFSRATTANISEGHGSFHYQENIQFCRQARGALNESLDHLITAFDETHIDDEILDKMRNSFAHCLKLLNGYISYLQRRKKENSG